VEPLNDDEVNNLKNGLLKTEIEKYQQAYAQEFEQAQSEKRDMVAEAQKHLEENALVVAQKIVSLALHGKSESTSLKACQYVYDRVHPVGGGAENPLEKLISQLTKTDGEDVQ
jgi:hypothetical protein